MLNSPVVAVAYEICILMLKEKSTPRISSSHAECFYTAVKVRHPMVSHHYLNCEEFMALIGKINLGNLGLLDATQRQ